MPSNYSLPSLTAHQTQPFFPGLTFLTRTKSIRQVRRSLFNNDCRVTEASENFVLNEDCISMAD